VGVHGRTAETRARPGPRAGRDRPRSSCGDRTWDAIDIALARVTSADELDDRISRITALVPGLNAGRLRQWCQATAVISVVQRLFRYRHDGAVPDKLLLDLAAGAHTGLKGARP
jgi:hypothetical protein